MANLALKGADGKLFWDKYVQNNPRFKEVEFEIEDGKSTPLFTKEGNNLKATVKIYKAGTKLGILNPKIIVFQDKKMAEVKLSGRKGLIPITRIKNPTAGNGTQYEDEVVDLINDMITQVGPLSIKIKGEPTIYDGILYAIKVTKQIKQTSGLKSDPKCDIILCRDIKRPLGKGSIYISHKKEGGAEAFQQYSGISDAAGAVISRNRIVTKFLSIVADNLQDSDRLEAPIIGYFKDTKLMNLAIFGPEFGNAHSLEHVHLIGQGKPQLTRSPDGKYFTLSFSNHVSLSGDLRLFSGPYVPVFAATYRGDRSFAYNGITYKNTRVGIYPYKKVFSNNEKTLFYDL
jgi:hypothetical protein